MRTKENHISCAGCMVARRQFLKTGGMACLAACGLLSSDSLLGEVADHRRTRVRIIYALHAAQQPGPDWPNKGYDFKPIMERVNRVLAKKCHGIEFVSSLATGPEQAQKILDDDKTSGIDGYLVYQMNCWNRVVQAIATSGKPVLYADFQFGGSGGFLAYVAEFIRKQTSNVGFVASSHMDDLVAAVRCFPQACQDGAASFADIIQQVRLASTPASGIPHCKPDSLQTLDPKDCIQRLKECKILAVRGQEQGPVAPMLGIPIEHVPFSVVNDAWLAADKDEAKAIADRWEKTATRVKGVPRETLEQSAAMYLAQKSVLKKYKANAITINCLGGFYGGHIHAYPCLGFHQLLNEGLVGACECDVRSTATMVAMTTLTQGRPGYISDPVVDTARRQIIYAHCVASNRVFGPQGSSNPFQILTHSEDRQGASVRSLLPTGYLTTTVEVSQDRKEFLIHQAKAVANDPDDRACRTKICGEPLGDIEKLFREWDQWGWHRVTYYGDLKAPIKALADAVGWKVVEES